MSRPRFLTDEDFRGPIVDAVIRTEPAIEIVSLVELGRGGLSDAEQLEFAADEGYILLSHDVNTLKGLASERVRSGAPMTGVLVCAQDAPTKRVAESIVMIWGASEAEEFHNVIEHLPYP